MEVCITLNSIIGKTEEKPQKAANSFFSVQKKKLINSRYLMLLFLPGFLVFTVFKLVPLSGLIIAFEDYTFKGGMFGSEFVGLDNFKQLFANPYFFTVMKNTLWISFLKIILGFPCPVILALIYNEISDGGFKRVTQTITYLPHFFSWVVLSGMVVTVFSPSTGIVNSIIEFCGGTPVYFLASKKYFVPVLIITDIWKEIGWGSIVYLAAISGVSSEIYEAAIIDGAKRWQKMFYITIPCIMPTIAVMLILRLGTVLDAGFDQIFNLYNPAVYDVADIIDTYTYREGIGNYRYSYATAFSFFKSIVGLVMILLTNSLVKRFSEDGTGVLY